MISRMYRYLAPATLGCALALGVAGPAQAEYPDRPIRLVVSDQAGGPGDIVARALGNVLGDSLRQPIVVENRAGAYGTLGLSAVARSAPDGYTIGLVYMPHTVGQTLYRATPYDLRRDFEPLAKIADLFNVLIVPPSVQAESPRQLAELTAAGKGEVNFGSGGVGSPAHLSGELFKRHAGVDAAHIPFRGPVDAMTNLVGGRVDFMFLSLPVAMPMINSGKVRALAVTSERPSPLLPQVPTMREAGYEDFVVLDWMGLVVPAGTPAAVRERLATEIRKAVATAGYREQVGAQGIEPGHAGPEEFGKLLDTEITKWSQFIDQIGLTLE